MKRITKTILNSKITYANETLGVTIENRNYNGFNHLTLNGENIYRGSTRECAEFLDGLVQFHLLKNDELIPLF